MHQPRRLPRPDKPAFFLLFVFFVQVCFGYEYILLESSVGGPLAIEGNRSLLQQRFTPASTFKIILAAAALEEGFIQADTRFACSDKHIRCCPRSLDLHQALVFSSNDYFKQVIALLGEQKIRDYATKWSFFSHPIAKNWLNQGLHSAVWAGTMQLTPEDQHQFMVRLARGDLPMKSATRDALLTSLEWPSPDQTQHLFGKTGSMKKVVWYTGFGKNGETWKVVTVCLRGPISLRSKAISLFYSRFRLTWEEKFLSSLEKK